jgi:malate synthase
LRPYRQHFRWEEILYEVKDHIIGLNVGRWDKIFSDIKVLGKHKDRISADRATINMSKFWMDNYAKRLIKICHSRGAYAIGGMSSFTPGKDPEVRKAQTEKVMADKQNEFDIGHDGCWVSHPYFIGYAMKAFVKENQVERTLEDFDKYPDLLMDGEGPRTIEGLRTNIRVGIAYMQGWNNDIGCVAWDDLMEDLATLEISRAQTWQWLHHGVMLDENTKVTNELVKTVFSEELEKISTEIKTNMEGQTQEKIKSVLDQFSKAKEDAQKLFLKEEMPDFISTQSDLYQ